MGYKFNPITGQFDVVNTSSGGGGSVDSVNGQTGSVNLETDDINVSSGYTPATGTVSPGDSTQEALQKIDGKAQDAQNDATQAISDALAAQTDATQALSDASTAQTDATQALSDISDTNDRIDNLTTSDIPEGSNLYFTQQRVLDVLETTTSFDLDNNQSSPADITGLVFDGSVSGFEFFATVSVAADTNKHEVFTLTGVNRITSWELYVTSTGTDTSGVVFSITNAGQVQYTTPNYPGFASVTFKYKAIIPTAIVASGVTSVNGRDGTVVLTKADVGLSNVDNLSLQAHLDDSVGAHAASAIAYDNGMSGLSSIEVQSAIDELAANSTSFPLKAPTGVLSDPPSYGFTGGDDDTGMYSTGDGNISFQANGQHRFEINQNDSTFTGDLHITGNIDAANYPPTGNSNKLAVFDNSGELTTKNELGFDPNLFNGLQINNPVVPENNSDGHTLHNFYTSYNPSDNSDQSWNNIYIQSQIGTDDSGFKLGDPTDIKSVLVLQDITYTSRRYGADGNAISIEYTTGGTAGAEVVSGVDFTYSIQIEDGVSTADQIIQAIDDSVNIDNIQGTLDYVVSGMGSNPQVVVGPTNLSGGENANGGINMMTLDLSSRNSSSIGFANGYFYNFDLGNNTDTVRAAKVQAFGGNINLADNTSVSAASAFEYGFSTTDTDSKINGDLRGINIYGNPRHVVGGVLGYQLGLNMTQARYMNGFQTTTNVSGDILESINSFADFNNISGDVGDNYYGISIQPSIGSTDGFFGVNISPNVGLSRQNSIGLNVQMDNVTVFAGSPSLLVFQDLTLTFNQNGDNSSFNLQYTSGGTAGSEVVNLSIPNISVQIENGVSTAQQIKDALQANFTVNSNITITISGVGSNPQVIAGPTNFSVGQNPANKKAAYLDGDVEITGALSFGGALSIGALNAYASKTLHDGGGGPDSIHLLISSPTIGANQTIVNADVIGVNTAALISIGNNSTITTSFFGISALGLPAVVSLGTGATVDKIAGATFALSLDGTASGGTVDQINLCNALAIPNGITTVNNLRGYAMELPFGGISSNTWGIYIAPDCHNWMKGALKIGGNAGSTDVEDSGLSLHIEGDTKFDGDIGFYNTTPVTQQTSSGPQTAGVVYTSTEQTMIQEMYNALRAYGLLS